ncbi:MAG: hypothetical protein ACE5HA_03260 [Anaerolineae bacterium]
MKSHWHVQAVIGIVVAGLILAGAAVFPSTASRGMVNTAGTSRPYVQVNEGASITGDYSGEARLNWVLAGIYSDTLATPTPQPTGTPAPADLGRIDLSLRLEQSGSAVSGYVLLDRSLVFTREHSIMVTPILPPPGPGTPTPNPEPEELDIGPRVTGTFDGVTLRLESERFSLVLSPEQRLADGQLIPEQRVTRQFSLSSTAVQDDGATLAGEYRETVWGFGLEPSTAVGVFTLSRPVFGIVSGPTPVPVRYRLYLPLISRNPARSDN